MLLRLNDETGVLQTLFMKNIENGHISGASQLSGNSKGVQRHAR